MTIPAYPLAAAIIAVCFVLTWTATANSEFWNKVLMPGRPYWTKPRAFLVSTLCAAINVTAVCFLFVPLSSLHLFIFFEVLFYLLVIAWFES